MNVAWDLCWGGSRSTKPLYVFPRKVAAAGNERYLLCAEGAAAVVSGSNRFSLGVLQRVDANRIIMSAWMCRWCCQTHCNGCMIVAWALFWGGSPSTNHESLRFSIPSLARPAISHPASQPAGRLAGWPKTKHQLAGRPFGHKPSPGWPASRTPQTKNQLATVAPAEAKRQPASQPAS